MYNTAILKIRCPHCGAVLSVKNIPNIESKSVPCPICKQKSPFVNFKVLPQGPMPQADPGTDLPENHDVGGMPNPDLTAFGQQPGSGNLIIGRLTVIGTGQSYQLMPGANIIGRKASASSAQFQIVTGDAKRMSREHLVITVVKKPGQGFMHYARLYKAHVNATSVNGTQLMFGDEVILNKGDIIQLPDANIRFDLPDEEGTDY